MTTTDYNELAVIANEDVKVLKKKGESYGDSWKARGGVGAFMMLARKWDRIENQCKSHGYDIFEAIKSKKGGIPIDGLLDDVADLRRYLLLVEEEVTAQMNQPPRTYVDPDADQRR